MWGPRSGIIFIDAPCDITPAFNNFLNVVIVVAGLFLGVTLVKKLSFSTRFSIVFGILVVARVVLA